MIIQHLIGRIPATCAFARLIIGSVVTALAISLGMVWILRVFDFEIGPAIPAAVGAIGAAVFAARMRNQRDDDRNAE